MFETAERAVVHASFGPYDQSTTASWDELACYETADLKRRQLAMDSLARLYGGEFVSWPDAAGKDVEFGMSEPNPAAALLWHRRAAESGKGKGRRRARVGKGQGPEKGKGRRRASERASSFFGCVRVWVPFVPRRASIFVCLVAWCLV